MKKITAFFFVVLIAITACISFRPHAGWQSKFLHQGNDGSLQYIADEKGNTIPDFSRVGYYHGDKEIPMVAVFLTIHPSNNAEEEIRNAIESLSALPENHDGFRGAILLKKGSYLIKNQISIQQSGIVLRGEGNETKLIAAGIEKRALIQVSGKGSIKEVPGTRTKVIDSYVPVGTHSFHVASAEGYKQGDRIIIYRPGTDEWIKDLQMDHIESRNGTNQWKPNEYNLQFERVITKVESNTITVDNPVVMEMESKYGGGEIFKYSFEGRLKNVGVEDLLCESEYSSDTAENHSWDAINFDKIDNGWVRNVTAKYFAYSCVNLSASAKNISVLNSNCFDHKSVITGGRRYSFNNNGQQNLFMNCNASDGRHDFVTGARTCGPNVFTHCSAKKTHADIGPHHRWSAGTLYDNIITDGEINIQDRGNWGSGHGWAGVTQILWNCAAKAASVQSPWVNGKNYSIGLKGEKSKGRLAGRPDGEWEGQNKEGLQPASLYMAQLKARKKL